MPGHKTIKSALISVFYKDGLDRVANALKESGVRIYSTGGTRSYLEERGHEVIPVEDLTAYPSILGGRVKTLHPKVFGGILGRREDSGDVAQLEEYEIPEIDLVIVDLYPFSETVAAGGSESDIIEKIDIGGVSLIRAAAKNFRDVLIVSSRTQYSDVEKILKRPSGSTLEERRAYASAAFSLTASYDSAIAEWFSGAKSQSLRYGENPHQKARFIGNTDQVFTQLHGKELSYNNLLDIDAGLRLVHDFGAPGCAVIKHNNACGAAIDNLQLEAWKKALAGDPVSAFGGILVFNTALDKETALEIDRIFFEIVLAPSFDEEGLEILKRKKNRIILQTKQFNWPETQVRSILNGVLEQDADSIRDTHNGFKLVTGQKPDDAIARDLEFAIVLVKHSKSNAITLVKNGQLIASGIGQTSRVDSLEQAIQKAERMGFSTKGAVMASDAFFPFPDCVEIAGKAGISAIAQPGGSIRDDDSAEAAKRLGITMVLTGIRHFKH